MLYIDKAKFSRYIKRRYFFNSVSQLRYSTMEQSTDMSNRQPKPSRAQRKKKQIQSLRKAGVYNPNIGRKKEAERILKDVRRIMKKATTPSEESTRHFRDLAQRKFNHALEIFDSISISLFDKPIEWGDREKLLLNYFMNNVKVDENFMNK